MYVVPVSFGPRFMPSYLQKRRRRWYAIMEIPKSLRQRFGKPRLVRSLETDSLFTAQKRVLHYVAGWKDEIAAARNETGETDDVLWTPTPSRVTRRALARNPHQKPKPQPAVSARDFARQLRNAKTEEERESIIMQIEFAADDIGGLNVDVGELPSTDPEARRFAAIAYGSLVPFTEHLNEWLSTSRTTNKTQDMDRSVINRFVSDFPMVQDVTRPDVRRWINKLISEDGLAPKTVQRMLSGLRG